MFFLDAFRNGKYPYRNNIKIYFFTCRYNFVIDTQDTQLFGMLNTTTMYVHCIVFYRI